MKRIIAVILAAMLLTACGVNNNASVESTPTPSPAGEPSPSATPTASPEPEEKFVVYDTIESSAIEDNMIDENSSRNIAIFLPPSYYENTEKRYPVIYFLHGHGDPIGTLTRKHQEMTELMNGGTAAEFITVEADCSSKLGGGFYANSPVTGRYEDFVTEELVEYIDLNYRTISNVSSRGIAGFSMGGFGALYLGMRHPDVFSAVYALGPGMFDKNGLDSAMKVWNKSVKENYGAIFSPDTSLPYPHANIPVFDGSEKDNQIVQDWYNGFGNWEQKVAEYLEHPQKLTAITIKYGKYESYPFIPDAVNYLSGLLTEAGIENTVEVFEGGHSVPNTFVAEDLLPFFTNNLSAE